MSLKHNPAQPIFGCGVSINSPSGEGGEDVYAF